MFLFLKFAFRKKLARLNCFSLYSDYLRKSGINRHIAICWTIILKIVQTLQLEILFWSFAAHKTYGNILHNISFLMKSYEKHYLKKSNKKLDFDFHLISSLRESAFVILYLCKCKTLFLLTKLIPFKRFCA